MNSSAQFDLIIRHAEVVTPDQVRKMDVGIKDETIAALESNLSGSANEEIDASGLHLFPGVIDSHVHFNDPGRSDWEGIETGSRAFAAGGGTLFFDMPLNASPPTIDVDAFDRKLAEAVRKSVTDFAFWGGIVPGNLEQLKPLAKRGVIGFKAFMCDSGIEDFPRADDETLREAMQRAADLDRLVAVHAESHETTQRFTADLVNQGRTSARDFLASRPIAAELAAIRRALDLAQETGCRLHVVHVSSGAGVALITEAARAGVRVTCESCPHYLILTEEDMARLGAVAKCAPPLRTRLEQDRLWDSLGRGEVATIGSDHSPCTPAMKAAPNFFKVWGGISGVQHTLPLLLTEGVSRGTSLLELARHVSINVVKTFNLPATKRGVAVGTDADLAIVDLTGTFPIDRDQLLDRHRQSPYVGRKLTAKVVQTILRGRTLFKNGRVVGQPAGKLVKPAA